MIVYHLLVRYCQYLIGNCSRGILSALVKQDSITLKIHKDYLIHTCTFLKYHSNTQFHLLVDIVVVDYPFLKDRFEVTYVLLSITRNTRLFLKTSVSNSSTLHSVISCYSVASWLEREAWDLFGVYFTNNMDLRRILTDYGFEGHPFRKDFPLSGYVELRYDENQKRILTDFIEVSQEYRHFDFL